MNLIDAYAQGRDASWRDLHLTKERDNWFSIQPEGAMRPNAVSDPRLVACAVLMSHSDLPHQLDMGCIQRSLAGDVTRKPYPRQCLRQTRWMIGLQSKASLLSNRNLASLIMLIGKQVSSHEYLILMSVDLLIRVRRITKVE